MCTSCDCHSTENVRHYRLNILFFLSFCSTRQCVVGNHARKYHALGQRWCSASHSISSSVFSREFRRSDKGGIAGRPFWVWRVLAEGSWLCCLQIIPCSSLSSECCDVAFLIPSPNIFDSVTHCTSEALYNCAQKHAAQQHKAISGFWMALQNIRWPVLQFRTGLRVSLDSLNGLLWNHVCSGRQSLHNAFINIFLSNLYSFESTLYWAECRKTLNHTLPSHVMLHSIKLNQEWIES